MKNCWRNDSEKTADDVIEHYASLDLLIVDEVGVQFGSAAEMAILQEIINARYEGILPTILISNLSPEELWAFISPGLPTGSPMAGATGCRLTGPATVLVSEVLPHDQPEHPGMA